MDLPHFPDLSLNRLQAALARHGLADRPVVGLPETGIFNAIFAVGDDLILRVPREAPPFVAAARKEAVAVPAARAAGVRTPELLIFDDTLAILPVPYSLYERVRGQLLADRPVAGQTVRAYRELGTDLARLHEGVAATSGVAELEPEGLPEPAGWPAELDSSGYLGPLEAGWISGWLDRLRERGRGDRAEVFRHGDVQASNVLVDSNGSYLALVDWGGCGWGDPAHDFAGVPFDAVPVMLEGYRRHRSVPEDGSFEAAIVLRQLHLALFLLRRPPQPRRSWAERPLGMLLDLLRFLGSTTEERFGSLRP